LNLLKTERSTLNPEAMGMAPEQVVARVHELIKRGDLGPGDRLPSEREFAKQLGINRTSLRAGLRSLIAMGVLHTRHGSGTYMSTGPSSLGGEALELLAALHGFTQDEIFEARQHLEALVAGLAAERATSEHLATMAEELANCFSALDDPARFLLHDIRFHRALGAASGNPILATLVGMVSTMHFERRSQTVGKAGSLRVGADMHQRIFRAIRARNRDEARAAMREHILQAQELYHSELIAQSQTEISPEAAP
jgi:GntR family transcriptional repressor for pyruvate dehydrogenase complex